MKIKHIIWLGALLSVSLGTSMGLLATDHKTDHDHKHGTEQHKDHKGHKDHDDHKGEEDHDHEEGHAIRVVVSDAKTNVLSVLDGKTGKVLAKFNTIGKLSGLYAGPEYLYGIHRDDSRMTVLHSGLHIEDHGNHQDLAEKAPYVLATLNVGKKPTHLTRDGERLVIYNDGDGTAVVFDESLLGITNKMQFIQTKKADHGAPELLGKVFLAGMYGLGRVDAFNTENGQFLKEVASCTKVHGSSVRKDTAFFGCTDGVLAIKVTGDNGDNSFKTWRIKNPAGAPEKVRVGYIAAHEKSNVVYGNFGNGLAKWSGTSGAATLKTLPLPAKPIRFTFGHHGKNLFVLTQNGELHRLNAATGKVLKSAKVMDEIAMTKTATNEHPVRPSFTLSDEALYLSSAKTGEVLKIHLDDLDVEQRWKVGGSPALITLTEREGVQH